MWTNKVVDFDIKPLYFSVWIIYSLIF